MRPQREGRPQQGQNERNPYQRMLVSRSLTGMNGGTGLFGGLTETSTGVPTQDETDSANNGSANAGPDGVSDNDDNDVPNGPNPSMTGNGSPTYQAAHPILNSIFGGGKANALATEMNMQSNMEAKTNADAVSRLRLEAQLRDQGNSAQADRVHANSIDELNQRDAINQQLQDNVDTQRGNDIINHPEGLKMLGNMGYDPINDPDSINPLDVGRSARNVFGSSLDSGLQGAENTQEGEIANQPYIKPLTQSKNDNAIATLDLGTDKANSEQEHDMDNPGELSDLFSAQNEKGKVVNANIQSETTARNVKPTSGFLHQGNYGPPSAGMHLYTNPASGESIVAYPEMIRDPKTLQMVPSGRDIQRIVDLSIKPKTNTQDSTDASQGEDIDAELNKSNQDNEDEEDQTSGGGSSW